MRLRQAVHCEPRMLRIEVSNPLPAAEAGASNGSGMALANIRDRLAQAYGEDHRFETMEPPEGGFAVLIEIPFERREVPAPAVPADKRSALAG